MNTWSYVFLVLWWTEENECEVKGLPVKLCLRLCAFECQLHGDQTTTVEEYVIDYFILLSNYQ